MDGARATLADDLVMKRSTLCRSLSSDVSGPACPMSPTHGAFSWTEMTTPVGAFATGFMHPPSLCPDRAPGERITRTEAAGDGSQDVHDADNLDEVGLDGIEL